MTDFTVDAGNGLRLLTVSPDVSPLPEADAPRRILEASFAHDADALLLPAALLPPAFFDLSSGVAGALLQQLEMYGGRRLALVRGPGDVAPTARFGEMEREARRRGRFGLFESEDEARAWLVAGAG